MSILSNIVRAGAAAQSTAYTILRSLRFRASGSGYLSRTLGTPTNSAVWTLSVWIKRGSLGSYQEILNASSGGGVNQNSIQFTSSDQLRIINYLSSTFKTQYVTTQVFRDTASWYHIVIRQNSSTGFTLYVNGQAVSSFGTATGPDASGWLINQSGITVNIGRETLGGVSFFDGYMADYYFIDGQALTPASFGESDATTGVWKPKKYTGTYGTNGFKLDFSDNSAATAAAIGKDSSGNGNNWTPNNISVTAGATYDSMTDVPTLTSATAANYCVLNPLAKNPTNAYPTFSNANLTATYSGADSVAYGTIGVTSGKFYWEHTVGTPGAIQIVGVSTCPDATYQRVIRTDTGEYLSYNGGAATWTTYGASYTTGDVVGVALDMTSQTIEFFKNGTSQGQKTSIGLSGLTITPFVVLGSSAVCSYNFGQRPFTYTPPSGFKALNTYNLPDSVITAGNKVFDATTYTGNGSALSVTNAAGFKPDFVWGKRRDAAGNHNLYDSIRGVTNYLTSNGSGAEIAGVSGLSAFNTNGFSVGSHPDMNTSGGTFVGWQWQAGQGVTNTNTNGSITSTVSANPSAGFSIVTYTGTGSAATVGHGLGVAPSFIFLKIRNNSTIPWLAYHNATGINQYLILSTTDAAATVSNYWGSSNPNSTTFGIGPYGGVNTSGGTYVAYCWSEVPGFSKFGSYIGNVSTDGPFVYLGFRPKYIMFKNINTTGSQWEVYDTSRDKYNSTGTYLLPAVSDAEGTFGATNRFDYLSNGFKVRNTGGSINENGATIIYAAFAENPFKNSLAR